MSSVSSMIWSTLQKGGMLGIAFIANLIMAQVLGPKEFGYVGILLVFINISEAFIDGGFGSALIQRQDVTKKDYSTTFYWNLVVSLLFYALIFIFSPFIESYYEMPRLGDMLRLQSIVLIINAFTIVQTTQLMKSMNFKRLAWVQLCASLVGAGVGIAMAYTGWGIWSFVGQAIALSVVNVVLFWIMSSWRPAWEFSWQSFRKLFNFGGMMLVSTIVERLYTNIRSLVIGARYTSTDLGYYTQAHKLAYSPISILGTVIGQVTFPLFSRIQDKEELKLSVRKNIRVLSFINIPMMALLVVAGEGIVHLLLPPAWYPAIPYFQALCVGGMMTSTHIILVNIFKSTGRSDIYFVVQFTRRVIGIGMVFVGIQFGVMGVVWAMVIYEFVSIIVNAIFAHRLIRYGLWGVLKDIMPNMLLATGVGATVWFSTNWLPLHYIIILTIQVVGYIVLYLAMAWLFRLPAMNVFVNVFKRFMNRKRN